MHCGTVCLAQVVRFPSFITRRVSRKAITQMDPQDGMAEDGMDADVDEDDTSRKMKMGSYKLSWYNTSIKYYPE
ncbi:uncharacterized protein N7479_004846 [Penicillium vulpinum]|uniref:uncharacterized protein n=1 Tax=Penicillium vulpinum TaxID=29845 RepID=UPI00254757CD|nr:uncharacterized protein N7479_004846 [Penicillium vulpinum]KAJ5964970.1 hypothetical protein N7479_004846 [Penicillium vulpinum]